MPATVTPITVRQWEPGAGDRMELYELMEAVGTTDYVRLQGDVTVQISGTATDIVAVVERCSRDPEGSEANWAPAEDDPFSGDLSAGMAPRPYEDPATGFWRVNITTLTGGNCKVSIVGGRT